MRVQEREGHRVSQAAAFCTTMILPQNVILHFFIRFNWNSFNNNLTKSYVIKMTIVAKNHKKNFFTKISKCQHYIQHF